MFKNLHKKPSFVYTLMVIMVFVGSIGYFIQYAQASAITAMKDTMTNENTSGTSDHVIIFTLPTGIDFDVAGNTDILRAAFPVASGFTTSGTWATSDFAFNDGTARTINAVAQGAGTIDCTVTAGVSNVCVAVDTTNMIFTIKPSSTYTASATGATITFTIYGTSPNGVLTNPTGAGSYKVTDAMCDETASCNTSFTTSHSGSFAVYAITNDQVTVTASVDPSLTFALSTNAVNLGTLTTGAVANQSFTAQTVTNATSGFVTTVLYNNKLQIDGTHQIADTTGTLTAGTEGFGIATSDAAQTITQDSACSTAPYNVTALTTSPQQVSSVASGPTNHTATICVQAAISSTTTAGSYSNVLTFISTGTF